MATLLQEQKQGMTLVVPTPLSIWFSWVVKSILTKVSEKNRKIPFVLFCFSLVSFSFVLFCFVLFCFLNFSSLSSFFSQVFLMLWLTVASLVVQTLGLLATTPG